MQKPQQLTAHIEISLTTKEDYSEKFVAKVKLDQLINLDSDSQKRKIINEIEDLVDNAMRDVSNNIHHSNSLTDGEWKRENPEE